MYGKIARSVMATNKRRVEAIKLAALLQNN
jgi:hypothetical protein